jgi:hypothetical protein
MSECRKARSRPIPFDCKAGEGHEGNCTPYTLPPRADWIESGFRPAASTTTLPLAASGDSTPDGA